MEFSSKNEAVWKMNLFEQWTCMNNEIISKMKLFEKKKWNFPFKTFAIKFFIQFCNKKKPNQLNS